MDTPGRHWVYPPWDTNMKYNMKNLLLVAETKRKITCLFQTVFRYFDHLGADNLKKTQQFWKTFLIIYIIHFKQ